MTAHVPHHVPAMMPMPAHHVMAAMTPAHHAVMTTHAVMIMHPHVHDGARRIDGTDHARCGGGWRRKADRAQGRQDGESE